MSDIPAFPSTIQYFPDDKNADEEKGMTLRDYFAIRATEQDIIRHMGQDTSRAEARYRFADDMLKAREAK